MKVKRGFPSGITFVKEKLRPLVNKIHQLDDEDLQEVDAFLDYLLLGPSQIMEPDENRHLKMYDFMDGGMVEHETEKANNAD